MEQTISKYLNSHGFSSLTRKNYASTLNKYFKSEGDIGALIDMDLHDAIEWIKEQSGPAKDKTLNEHFNRIRAFVSWYKGEHNLKTNYDVKGLTHDYVNTTNPKILSDKEIMVAMLSMSPSEQATFTVYLELGLRKNEIEHVTPTDFLDGVTKNIYSTKTHSERTVFATSEKVINIIKEDDVKSFVKPYVMEKVFAKIKKSNDIYITFNILRHTFATQYADKGGNVFRLAKIMGNSVETVLTNYFNNNPVQAKEEYENIFNHRAPLKSQEKYIEYLEAKIKELEENKKITQNTH